MPIYTKTGDRGDTGLFGNQRVPKDHVRIEAYGTIDELNAFVGLLRAEKLEAEFDGNLETIQNTLFDIGADLATENGRSSLARVEPGIAELERWIDRSENTLPPLRTFVLPAGNRHSALLHVMRTIARRAERRYWTLVRATAVNGKSTIPEPIGIWLNRLSDLFFSWARRENHNAGIHDVPWKRAP